MTHRYDSSPYTLYGVITPFRIFFRLSFKESELRSVRFGIRATVHSDMALLPLNFFDLVSVLFSLKRYSSIPGDVLEPPFESMVRVCMRVAVADVGASVGVSVHACICLHLYVCVFPYEC